MLINSLNVTKTKYSFFHKTRKKDGIPIELPRLQINNYNVERIPSIKFLGVLLDENISWKDPIKYTENKIAKNIEILYKARDYLSKKFIVIILCLYSHICKLCQFSVGKYDKNKLKIHSQQMHAIRIIFRKDKFSHTKELFVEKKVFNVYQLNILNNLIFIHKVKTETAPSVFLPKFQKPAHLYPTNFSKLNYIKPTF